VWDVRQPGFFLFYLTGGTLFGFTEVGVHVFETLYLIAFAVVLQRTLRPRVEHAWVAAVAPLFVVGAYWAAAGAPELTQPEMLVAFPLYVAIWGVNVDDARPASRWRMLATGVAGAAVVGFKLFYLPIALIVWLPAFAHRTNVLGTRAAAREYAWLAVGFVVPLAVAVAYFAVFGSFYELFWTTIVFPPKQRSLDLRDWTRLRTSLKFFGQNFVWAVPLAIVGVLAKRPPRDRFVLGLLVWLVLGAGLLLLQTWYPYQFLLLVTPLALLAVFGFDRAVTWMRASGDRRGLAIGLVVASVVLAFVPARSLARTSVSFVRFHGALTADGRARYHDKYAPWYVVAARDVAALNRTRPVPGRIHVFGDYELHRQSHRRMAIAINGLTAEQLDDRLWLKTRVQLATKRPPYVFVSDFAADIMRGRSPETRAFLAREYCRLVDADGGRWLAARRLGGCR
jgi:hypothetical protein